MMCLRVCRAECGAPPGGRGAPGRAQGAAGIAGLAGAQAALLRHGLCRRRLPPPPHGALPTAEMLLTRFGGPSDSLVGMAPCLTLKGHAFTFASAAAEHCSYVVVSNRYTLVACLTDCHAPVFRQSVTF